MSQEHSPKVPGRTYSPPPQPTDGQATTIPPGCAWDGPADARTLNHVMDCPVCSELWPLIARAMRQAKGRALPSDDPKYLGSNVGYKDK